MTVARREAYIRHLHVRGLAPATIVYRTLYLDQFLSFLARHGLDETEVTPRDIERYRIQAAESCNPRWKRQRPVVWSTMLHRLSTVKYYMVFLKTRGDLMFNPAQDMLFPRRKRRLPKNIPSPDEMGRLLNAPDTSTPRGLRDKAILEVLYSTALRRKEVLDLKVYDVDLVGRTVRVEKGKNGRGRVVPIGGAARRAVEAYIKGGRQKILERMGVPRSRWRREPAWGETALFLNGVGRRMEGCSLAPLVRKYARKAAIEKKVTPHSFRHACATHMMRGGADIRTVQRMLGHSHILTTQIYTHVVPADLKATLTKHHPRGRLKQ